MGARRTCLLLLALIPALAGCVAGVEYEFHAERDDTLVGAWRAVDGREHIHVHVSAANDTAYRAVMVDDSQVTRFDFLLSRVAGSTYVNIDLSTVSILEHRSRKTETLNHSSPVYFLLLYRKEDAQVVIAPMDQEKLIRDFRAPQAAVGSIRGKCPTRLLFSEPEGDATQDEGLICVLAASTRSAFESYLRDQQKMIFDGRHELTFHKVQ